MQFCDLKNKTLLLKFLILKIFTCQQQAEYFYKELALQMLQNTPSWISELEIL